MLPASRTWARAGPPSVSVSYFGGMGVHSFLLLPSACLVTEGSGVGYLGRSESPCLRPASLCLGSVLVLGPGPGCKQGSEEGSCTGQPEAGGRAGGSGGTRSFLTLCDLRRSGGLNRTRSAGLEGASFPGAGRAGGSVLPPVSASLRSTFHLL